MDSIIKNHPSPYKELFQQNIVSNFAHVFSVSEVDVRLSLHKLRQTWNDVFSSVKLHQLDLKTREFDPKWPVAKEAPVAADAVVPASGGAGANIHINPAVFNRQPPRTSSVDTDAILEELRQKELELLQLKKKALEMEVEKEKVKQKAELVSSSSHSLLIFFSSFHFGTCLP